VEDGVTGWLVAPGKEDALADAMDHAAIDASERRRRGEAGRAKVLGEFTPEKCVDAHLALYASLRP
jgi:glycosyltransferase involved in cell wall biosynthesis